VPLIRGMGGCRPPNTFAGYSIRCGDDPFGWLRAVSDGYEVIVEKLVNDRDPT